MMVDPDVDVHTKARKHRKILRKTQKNTTTYWKPKEYWIPK